MTYRLLRLGKPILILAATAGLGEAVMLLWNAVMPAVFAGVHSIDYWHGLELLVLSRILLGGFRGGGGWRQHRHWRRWQAMTTEEREYFKKSLSERYKGKEQT